MLNEREITLLRASLILRLDQLKEDRPEVYQEAIQLLQKLWCMRRDTRLASQSPLSP